MIPFREPRAVEAIVYAGGAESRYVRMGSGRRVVLLLPEHRAEWLNGDGVRQLARELCLLVPDLPRTDAGAWPGSTFDADRWLLPFLDGVGVERCGILAERALAGAILRAARADERIERVALVGCAQRTGDPDMPLCMPCPTLAWAAGPQPDGAAIEALITFLRGTPAPGDPRDD